MYGNEGRPRVDIRQQPFAAPEKVQEIVAVTYKNLKQKKPVIQRSMSLYLANKDTEYILFKPLKVLLPFKVKPIGHCLLILLFC